MNKGRKRFFNLTGGVFFALIFLFLGVYAIFDKGVVWLSFDFFGTIWLNEHPLAFWVLTLVYLLLGAIVFVQSLRNFFRKIE